ncbi:mite allergen Der p 7-like isoform X2 [Diprion similis]|uniref:mite allergen Der p 7-like isoform X2 n=1 Tax=Diprion similis TaxID=362088 RepID=UPI001EF9A607|nr:mite allergen Der p 7-like isoform X2 [Diprion similis]
MKTVLALFLVIVAVASAAKTHQKRSTTYSVTLNDYVDTVIDNIQAYVSASDLEPLSIPNVTESFSVKELLITWSGRLSLYDGELTGLSSVKRYGDVNLGYDGQTLSLDANMGVDESTGTYTYYAKLLGSLHETGSATVTVKEIDSTVGFSANVNNYTIAFDSFEINSVGSTTAELSGNVLTDWMANAVINTAIPVVKRIAIKQINSEVNSVLSSVFDEANSYVASLVS